MVTQKDAPQEWGQLHNNLAVVNMSRVKGDREANLEAAIGHFTSALSVFKKETDPYLWANPAQSRRRLWRPQEGQPRGGPREADRAHRGGADRIPQGDVPQRVGAIAAQPRHRLSGPHPRRPCRQSGQGDLAFRGRAHGHYARDGTGKMGADAAQHGRRLLEPRARRPRREPAQVALRPSRRRLPSSPATATRTITCAPRGCSAACCWTPATSTRRARLSRVRAKHSSCSSVKVSRKPTPKPCWRTRGHCLPMPLSPRHSAGTPRPRCSSPTRAGRACLQSP